MMDNTRTKVLSNLIWRMMERFGAHGVTFIVEIVLARLLDPKVFGVLALVTVFTAILQVFVDSGLGNALIQKKNADDLDFSSVFFFNIATCIFLYITIYFSAPFIAHYYEMEELVPIIRVMSVVIVISGVKNVQQAYVSKNLMFKKFFFSTLGGTIGAAVVGIAMAYLGYGIWALVFQNIFNQAIDTLILWMTIKWRPKFVFSWTRLKTLLKYGWKLLMSSLLEVLANNIRALVIGKLYTADQLAFYNRGQQFPQLIVANINSAIDSVLFPVLSNAQDDLVKVKRITRRAIKTSAYIMWPCMVGIAVCAEPLVELLLTAKWLPCVPFLRIYCVIFALYPIHTANLNAIKACGRSDIYLRLEVLKKITDFTLLFIIMREGVLAIAATTIVSAIIAAFINTHPNKKIIQYGLLEQFKDVFPELIASIVMGTLISLVLLLDLTPITTLVLQIIAGFAIYVIIGRVVGMESFYYCLGLVKDFFKR